MSEILRITKAAGFRCAGRPAIVLGAGEPGFDTPEEAARRAIAEGATEHTALDGTPELKEAVRRKFRCENGLDFGREQVTCGAGGRQVPYNAFTATLDPGDGIVIPAPD